MTDPSLFLFLELVTVSIGAGTSVYVVISFFRAVSDGVIDASERRLLKPGYIILRTVTAILALLLIFLLIITEFGDGSVILRAIFVSILAINSFAMITEHIPARFGPPVAASTWYMYLLLVEFESVYGKVINETIDFQIAISIYILFTILMILLFNTSLDIIKNRLSSKSKGHLGEKGKKAKKSKGRKKTSKESEKVSPPIQKEKKAESPKRVSIKRINNKGGSKSVKDVKEEKRKEEKPKRVKVRRIRGKKK